MSRRGFRPFRRPRVDDEVRDELDFHLEALTRDLVARGLTPEAARARALKRMGDLDVMRNRLARLGEERNKSMRRTEWFAEFRQDIRYAVRSLLKSPGFALTALVTLGVGVGATSAIFSAVYSVVLRPLPFDRPDRVMVIGEQRHGNVNLIGDVSVGNFTDLKREATAFSSFAASYGVNLNLVDGTIPERVEGSRVTAEFFSVFRVAPIHGRVLGADDDQPGGPAVAVLSHRLWTRRFGADPAVVGKTIMLNSIPYIVVGIMPKQFDLTGDSEELWLPAGFTPDQMAQHDNHYLTVYGRLADGASVEQASGQVNTTLKRLVELYPDANAGTTGIGVDPMFNQFVGNARQRLLILLGAAGLVLLIGCVNVANMLLARGATRTKELALRAALGAGHGRIVRQLLTESLVLAGAAGAIGVGLAFALLKVLIASAPTSVPRLEQASIDGPALVFAVLVSAGCAVLFGLLPALRTVVPNLQLFLREGGRGSSHGPREWLRRGLIAVEVAIALVLLVGAGLLVRTAINVSRVDSGFDPAGVLSARITLPAARYQTWDQVTEAFTRIVAEIQSQPGVTGAGISSQVPSGPGGNSNGLVPEGRPLEPASAIDTRLRIVSSGYVSAMRIPLKLGRDFTSEDRVDRPRVMLVNEAFAKIAWPGVPNPIGKRVYCCEEKNGLKEVIGVVADVRWQGPAREATPEFYLPVAQAPVDVWTWLQRSMTLVVRGSGDPTRLLDPMRQAVARVDPSLPLYGVSTMNERVARSLAEGRFNTRLLTLLGAVGLMLAAVGIYGVIAYFVARRTRELGIRMALGASRGTIQALVIKQGLIPVSIGVGVGLVLSLSLSRVLISQLRGVQPHDPITLTLVAGALVGVAIAASLVPARRATRVDTVTAIREE